MDNLADYFSNVKGTGILATSNSQGEVDLAIYATPHVIDNTQIAFIMRDRLSYKNLKTNPKAAYMFIEKSDKYIGKRLYLEMSGENSDPELIEQMRRRTFGSKQTKEKCYVVYFKLTHIRPLLGNNT